MESSYWRPLTLLRHLEIRPVILSESEGSLRPASQILRCAQDDKQNASSPLNGKPSLQMSVIWIWGLPTVGTGSRKKNLLGNACVICTSGDILFRELLGNISLLFLFLGTTRPQTVQQPLSCSQEDTHTL